MKAIIQKNNNTTLAEFTFADKKYQCAVGKNGIINSDLKQEGDGCTPTGLFKIIKVFYRPDRISNIETKLPMEALASDFGWCDDPKDKNYNQLIKLPYDNNHEKLWREDELYDIVGVLNYNYPIAVPGLGSAIFIHVATKDYQPTEGCIALAKNDLIDFLAKADKETIIEVKND